MRRDVCDSALKPDLGLKGTIREGMRFFWSGFSGAGLWAQKEAVLPKSGQK